jgi:tryptophan-rich sensory protein
LPGLFFFFGLERIACGLAEIVILLLVIIANTVMFWRIDRLAGMLYVPYSDRAAYATILNASLWFLYNT